MHESVLMECILDNGPMDDDCRLERRTGLYSATASELLLVPAEASSDVASTDGDPDVMAAGMAGILPLAVDSILESSVEVIRKDDDVPDVGGVKPVW